MDMIRIFVGTESGNEKAEIALEYSIRATTTGPYHIVWMRDDNPNSVWQNWNKGRNTREQNTKTGWKTNFSNFRWAIPELCDFNGLAIYLDVDQIVLKDIRQMWQLPMDDCAYLAITPERTDVMLIDCSKFADSWWPSLNKIKPSLYTQRYYRKLVQQNSKVGTLSTIYNCLDGIDYGPDTRLVHYTEMKTQPWHPFPNTIEYKPHPNVEVEQLWHDMYQKALLDGQFKGSVPLSNSSMRPSCPSGPVT